MDTTTDHFCFHCCRTEHGRQVPKPKQVKHAIGRTVSGLAMNLVRDGDPIITGTTFVGQIIPRERCHGWGED